MTLSNAISVIQHSDRIETQLSRYESIIGADYRGYRGHIYRVLSYALHFLGDESARPTIETALVYHDIGLWSDKAISYLEPSIDRAQSDNASRGWGLDPELIEAIIYWHHKVTPYRGRNAAIVNAVRKADWIDASGGRLRLGMPKPCIERVAEEIPADGFYDTLARIGPELAGSLPAALRGLMRVYK
ncbi:MAG: phosphohydrolase, partial [Myxococcota bacterium]